MGALGVAAAQKKIKLPADPAVDAGLDCEVAQELIQAAQLLRRASVAGIPNVRGILAPMRAQRSSLKSSATKDLTLNLTEYRT
jgi:hypothetical protein